MKKFRLGGGFALAALFLASVFLGSCDDDYWEYPASSRDYSLDDVTINATYDDLHTTATVTFTIPKNADGVIYTIDGNDPTVRYDESGDGLMSYFGKKYTGSGSVEIKSACTLKALAYRLDKNLETAKHGDVGTQEIDIDQIVTYQFLYVATEESSDIIQKVGDYDKKFSFYSGDFMYTEGGLTKTMKYRIDFIQDSTAGYDGEGYWELYLTYDGEPREDSENGTEYRARGIFDGSCLSGTSPTNGSLTLYTLKGKSFDIIAVKMDDEYDYVFDLELSKYLIKKVTADY